VGYQNRTTDRFADLIRSKVQSMRWYGKRLNVLYRNTSRCNLTLLVSSSCSSHRKMLRVITNHVDILAAREEDHIIYNPTKSTCPHFTGREGFLRNIAGFLKPRGKDDVPSRREFLLYGIGGAGKTQICLKFAEQYSGMYGLVKETWRSVIC